MGGGRAAKNCGFMEGLVFGHGLSRLQWRVGAARLLMGESVGLCCVHVKGLRRAAEKDREILNIFGHGSTSCCSDSHVQSGMPRRTLADHWILLREPRRFPGKLHGWVNSRVEQQQPSRPDPARPSTDPRYRCIRTCPAGSSGGRRGAPRIDSGAAEPYVFERDTSPRVGPRRCLNSCSKVHARTFEKPK